MSSPDPSVFQFHKGTIKTQVMRLDSLLSGLFQFHKGTIKTYLRIVTAESADNISIP